MEKTGYGEYIWDYFMKNFIGNPIGVAALMGNLYAESGLYPDRVQGDVPYSDYSKEYTRKVDTGEIGLLDFVHNGPNGGGYGLAQWTYHTRKLALYELWQSGGYSSIGGIDLACDFLGRELFRDFPGVLEVLKTATELRTASDKVLHDFEAPADQSESVEIQRMGYAMEVLQAYYTGGGSNPDPDIPDEPDIPEAPEIDRKPLSKLLMLFLATD